MDLLSLDEWKHFRYEVKNKNRYIFDKSLPKSSGADASYRSAEEFLGQLLQFLQKANRFIVLPQNTILWRAQLDGKTHQPPENTLVQPDGTEIPLEGLSCRAFLKPHDCERMTPYSDKAKEGRVNPKGIPCLYTATDPHTALSEMKPMVGSYLSVAEFVTVRALKIVDFASVPIKLASEDGDPTDEEMAIMTWEGIGDAFSDPVVDSDNVADYAATQIIAELFRRAGYDGIRYKSKLVEFKRRDLRASNSTDEVKGRNIALFDLNSAKCKPSKLYKFDIERCGAFDFREVDWMVFRSDQIP